MFCLLGRAWGLVWGAEGTRGAGARVLAAIVAASFVALFCGTAPASAGVGFARAWGWGVLDGQSQFETCTTSCQGGLYGGGAGQLYYPGGVAVDGAGDVFVADTANNRIDEFSSSGAFIRMWGWGVSDGASQFEICTTSCGEAGIAGGGAGQLDHPSGVAVIGASDVFVADFGNNRIDEFSPTGSFIRAWGWGVSDGRSQLETCTTSCQAGLNGGGAGQLNYPEGVAFDGSNVFVADSYNQRIDEFSSTGGFARAWGWGVVDGDYQFETCTTSCEAGVSGGGAGQLYFPDGVAVNGYDDVFVADIDNNRIDEFSSSGAFIQAWGWGVVDGKGRFETCTTSCEAGIAGGGAGQLDDPEGVAVDGSGDVYVADTDNRIDEFSPTGSFTVVWGWGVSDGASQFESCTSSCEAGLSGGGAGQLDDPEGVAVDGAGDVFVADNLNQRIDQFGPQHTLTVSKSGTGAGTVTSSPAGVSCGASCTAAFTQGTAVTLSATPVSGSVFAGWSGSGCSGTGTCVVTMSSDQAVTATFTTIQYALGVSFSLAGSGAGSVTSTPAGISCPGTCSQDYAQGTVVTLTATPASGSVFVGWSGSGCSGTGACVVTMSSDQTVTATFNATPPGTHTLIVAREGDGSGTVTSSPAGIDCGITVCEVAFPSGQVVTLTATPASGSVFAGWSGSGCSDTGACVVTLTGDQSVTASFRARPAISGLSLSAKAFKPAASGPSTQPVSRHSKRGVVVRYTLNQSATLRFTIQQQLPGRRTGKRGHARCVAPSKHNRNAPRCTRTVTLPGSFTVTGTAGANSFRFTGRLAGRTLPPGGYTLIATPTAAGLAGNPVEIALRVSA